METNVISISVQACLSCGVAVRQAGSWYCPNCGPNRATEVSKQECACLHKLWYSACGSVGLDYLTRKVGVGFFESHRAPQVGETLEVCAGCGKVRYFVTGAGMADIIHAAAEGGKVRKRVGYHRRNDEPQPLDHPWKMGGRAPKALFDDAAFAYGGFGEDYGDSDDDDLSDLRDRVRERGRL